MFLDFILVLVIGLIGGIFAKKINQPTVVGYLLAGLAASFLFGHLKNKETIDFIAQIGVAFLLFALGIEFSYKRFTKLFKISVVGALLQIVLTTLIFKLILTLFGLSSYEALFLACCFSMSSTAVLVKILTEKAMLESITGEILVAWLLVQDLAVIPLIILLPILKQGTLNPLPTLFWPLLKVLLLTAAVVFLGRKIAAKATYLAASFNNKEILLLTAILLCLATAYLTQMIGLSFILGAFLGGITIAETLENQAILSEIKPLRDLFTVVFFVSLPMLSNTSSLLENFALALIISLIVIAVKFLVSFFISFYFGYHSKISFLVAVGLVEVGEFAFVLGRTGLKASLISESSYSLILSVTMITIILTPFLFNLAPALYNLLFKKHLRFFQKADRNLPSSELLYENHVILCGFGRMGKYIGRALEMSNIPYLVVEINRFLVTELRSSGINALYGDPADLSILDFAQVGKAKLLILAIPDFQTQQQVITQAKTRNSNLKIISRTHFEDYQKLFKVLGADVVVHPEFSASLEVIRKISKYFDISEEIVNGRIARLKIEHGL